MNPQYHIRATLDGGYPAADMMDVADVIWPSDYEPAHGNTWGLMIIADRNERLNAHARQWAWGFYSGFADRARSDINNAISMLIDQMPSAVY